MTRRNRTRRKLKRKGTRGHRSSHRGGRITGRGAFGCIVQPHPTCANGTIPVDPRFPTIVAKVSAPLTERTTNRMNERFFTEEAKAAEIVRRIGPAIYSFLLLPFASCPARTDDPDVQECGALIGRDTTTLLWMEAAEGDLLQFVETPAFAATSLETLLLAMRPVLLGIHLLHTDIKVNNILYGHSDGVLWCKLGDMGQVLVDPDDFATLRNEDLSQLVYVFHLLFYRKGYSSAESRRFLEVLRSDGPIDEVFSSFVALLTSVRHFGAV